MNRFESVSTMINNTVSVYRMSLEMHYQESTELYSAVLALERYYVPGIEKVRVEIDRYLKHLRQGDAFRNNAIQQLKQEVLDDCMNYEERIQAHNQKTEALKNELPQIQQSVSRTVSVSNMAQNLEDLKNIELLLVKVEDTNNRCTSAMKSIIKKLEKGEENA